jgi:manganese transport protein
MAGQTNMDGFVDLKIPLNLRRVITMLPALAIIILGVNPMNALVLSQVALSFILPVPIIQMLIVSGDKKLMGSFANKPVVKFLGILIAVIIITLNAVLMYLTFTGKT